MVLCETRNKVSLSCRPVWFRMLAQDAHSAARSGVLETPHGSVATPAFMPVGTQATVKGLTPDQIRDTGTEMLLANTYHLALRPGEAGGGGLGGLHSFMGWNGPDSHGFRWVSGIQSFGPEPGDRAGVTFRSHLDGALELTPERAVAIQEKLGADVAMCLDQCPRLPATKEEISEAVNRTVDWACAMQGGSPAS